MLCQGRFRLDAGKRLSSEQAPRGMATFPRLPGLKRCLAGIAGIGVCAGPGLNLILVFNPGYSMPMACLQQQAAGFTGNKDKGTQL